MLSLLVELMTKIVQHSATLLNVASLRLSCILIDWIYEYTKKISATWFFERSTVSSLDHQVFCIGHLVDLGHFIQINVVSFLNFISIDHIRIELILLKTMMAQNAHLFHEAPHLVVGSDLGVLEYFSRTFRKPQWQKHFETAMNMILMVAKMMLFMLWW